MKEENITSEKMEKLLSQQTVVILDAVEKRLEETKKEFKTEIRGLSSSIDKFVELYTKQEQEFTIMREHLNRLETRISSLETRLA